MLLSLVLSNAISISFPSHRVRKEHWARIISAATEYDTAITLAQLEAANRKVHHYLHDALPFSVSCEQLLIGLNV